jgi:ATP-binding cassette subfamily B protein
MSNQIYMFKRWISQVKNAERMKYLKLYRYLLPLWKKELLVLILSGITMLLGLVNPFLAKLIIDKAYRNRDLKLFIILIAIGATIFILNGIIDAVTNYLNRYIRFRVSFDLNRKVFKRLQRFPYSFFQDSSTGEHLYKISYDIEMLTQLITNILPQVVTQLPKSLFILGIVFYLNWKVGLFTLALAPFLSLPAYYFIKRRKQGLTKWVEASQGIFKGLQEVLSHTQLVKAFGRETHEIRHYIHTLIERIRVSLKYARLEISALFATSLVNRVIVGLITFYGGYQLIKGEMTLGTLSAITVYLTQLSGLQQVFISLFREISLGLVSYERLETILNAQVPVIIEDKNAKEILFSEGRIEFRDLTFSYKQEKIVLQNLSFCIKGASCIALVGPSGCGKSTIINLILRLYNLTSGAVLIDGRDVRSVKSKSLYAQIGVALQEPYLWNDTIENNIRYGNFGVTAAEIAKVAEVTCIDELINSLKEGYRAVIGENACKISEGQKQRIAIARAVIKKPKILILDEALSSVDMNTEAKIINNVKDFLKETTLVIVSHRISAIKKMDLVYFLAGPGEMLIGSHAELMRNVIYQRYLASLPGEGTA